MISWRPGVTVLRGLQCSCVERDPAPRQSGLRAAEQRSFGERWHRRAKGEEGVVFLHWGLWVQGIRCCQALLLLQLGQSVQACRQYQGGPKTRVYLEFTQHRPGSPDLKPVMLP